MNRTRVLFGLFLAPISLPICLLAGMTFSDGSLSGAWGYAGMVSVTVVSYLGTFFIGLPLVIYLRNKNKLSFPRLAVCGGISGIAVLFLTSVALAAFLDSITSFTWQSLVWGAAMGLIISLTFGVIAGVGNGQDGPKISS